MQLKEFIATTLVEIQQGVQQAIERCGESQTAGVINPVWPALHTPVERGIREVSFDIAVTVSEGKTGERAGGIKVAGIGIGGMLSGTKENNSISRIQFAIPIVPPTTVVKPG